MEEVYVAREDEFSEQSRKLIEINDVEIGVFRIDNGFVAWRNECAHRGGPVCQGRLFQKVEEVLRPDRTIAGLCYVDGTAHVVCPWHGYEYDLRTGLNNGNSKLRLRKVDVAVRDGAVYVRL